MKLDQSFIKEMAANQCINLALALDSISNTATLDNVKQIASGIIGTITNVATVNLILI